MISSDTTDSTLLGDLQWVTTGAGARRRREEAVLVQVGASMHDIEHQYHVPTAATVPERREVQLLQPFFVRQLPELRDKACCPSLDPLHSLRVGSVEWSLDMVTIFQVWPNHGLVE